MKHLFIFAGLLLSTFGTASPLYAQATRSISASQARGEPQIFTVELHWGFGVTLNFRATGEPIRRVWLDDPSQVTLDFDDPGCAVLGEPGNCAASVIHLRRIEPIDFPNLPAVGTTLLTVLTDEELYQFQLTFPDAGSPDYYALEIQADQNTAPPTVTTIAQLTGDRGADVVEQGLLTAEARGLIAKSDPLWDRVQSFLAALRQGVPATEAATQAGISQALVVRLAELGTASNSPTVQDL